ncbi:hypothetical protein KDH_56660 [Dictyobacter sp. S3.2.2.5]|uniref:Uncharacterized protein n=1 Tax=Dictyobacter halimunensis TaxID=3026934 RepID=A0ABQ6G2I4_9CHLR|nr:hypothetical protein KDH_56660 [Dictyobacter sp. S3.2.2.5]
MDRASTNLDTMKVLGGKTATAMGQALHHHNVFAALQKMGSTEQASQARANNYRIEMLYCMRASHRSRQRLDT